MKPRIALLATLLTVVLGGALFAPIFTPGVLVLPLGVVLGAVLIGDEMTAAWRPLAPWRPLIAGVTGVVSLLVLVSLRKGSDRTPAGLVAALRAATVDGWRRVFDFTWPVRPDPIAILFLGLVLLLGSLVALELLRARRPLGALAPGLAVIVLAQVYTATPGRYAIVAGLTYCALAVTALVNAEQPRSARRARTRPTGRPIMLVGAIVAVTGIAAGVVLAVPSPYSLREHYRPISRPAVTTNPLDEIADRLLAPKQQLFRYRTAAPADRWSQVILDRFDGDQWTSSGGLRWLGADNRPAGTATAHQADVTILNLTGPWLPTPGPAIEVTGVQPMVAVDSGTLVAPDDVTGDTYRLTWSAPAVPATGAPVTLVDGPDSIVPPGIPSDLSDLAREAAGDAAPGMPTAKALESYLRSHDKLAVGRNLPTGHSYAQLAYFLTQTHRGTSEQFATAYAVLGRALGLPVRVAVGFRRSGRPDAAGDYVVRNADVLAWPEIDVTGSGWVAMDPIPTGGNAGKQGPVTSTAAPIADPTFSPSAPATPPSVVVRRPAAHRSSCTWCIAAVIVAAGAGTAAAWPVSVIIRKRRRARRRRASRDPRDAVVGAWHEVRDRCTDNGVADVRGLTPRDLRRHAGHLLDDGGSERLYRLGRIVDHACWSTAEIPPTLGEQAWHEAATIFEHLARRPVRVRWRAAVSTASIRYRSDGGT